MHQYLQQLPLLQEFREIKFRYKAQVKMCFQGNDVVFAKLTVNMCISWSLTETSYTCS